MSSFTFERPKATLCTSEQIAARTGTSSQTVRRWSEDGDAPAPFVAHPKVHLWLWEEWQAWLDAGRPSCDPGRSGASDPPDNCD